MPEEVKPSATAPEATAIDPSSAGPHVSTARTQQAPPVSDSAVGQLPPPELFNKFLDLQAKELDVRIKEAELESVKLSNAHDFSKKAVDVQSAYFMQESKFRHGRFKWGVVVASIIILSGFVLLAVLALHGAEKIAEEILKDVVLLAGGGAGGYGIAKYKANQAQQQNTSPTDPASE